MENQVETLDLAVKFAGLTLKKRAIQDDLKRVNEELDAIETQLLDEMLARGASKLTVEPEEGKPMTIYISHRISVAAKDGDRNRAVITLFGEGMLDCLMPGVKRLSGLFREFEKTNDESILPEPVRGVFVTEERAHIGCRKA